jgi:hypothetical protein
VASEFSGDRLRVIGCAFIAPTKGLVTLIDARLGAAALIGLVVNAVMSWWWADPVSQPTVQPAGRTVIRHPAGAMTTCLQRAGWLA